MAAGMTAAMSAAAPDAPAPVIETSGLEKAYGPSAPVLTGVDLSVGQGERVALIGANGSGKSTLMRCLIGLVPLTAGSVSLFGHRFTHLPAASARAAMRRRIGFVFQNHSLVRRRSVLSNVVHGLLGEPGSWRAFTQATAPEHWRRRAMVALEEVGLADRALDRADTLSGGQQQRVAIARALVRRPELLIADEPAASLDPAAGREVMALFVRLAEEHGITLLFSSHDMAHAAGFSDRVVGLKEGRIAFDRPSGAVSAEMLEATFEGSHG
ncbi:MAG: ATP-binding cassette domain-containing protein [Pseudomonadota bacterium]